MMDLFFKSKSAAVIGTSGMPGKLGYVIVENIADIVIFKWLSRRFPVFEIADIFCLGLS